MSFEDQTEKKRASIYSGALRFQDASKGIFVQRLMAVDVRRADWFDDPDAVDSW